MNRIFVYGTLKENGSANNLMDGYKVSDAILKDHALWIKNYPMAVYKKGFEVHGELWEVTSLDPLDRYEGHPNLFRRSIVPITSPAGDFISYAYIYQNKIPETAKGPFKSYELCV